MWGITSRRLITFSQWPRRTRIYSDAISGNGTFTLSRLPNLYPGLMSVSWQSRSFHIWFCLCACQPAMSKCLIVYGGWPVQGADCSLGILMILDNLPKGDVPRRTLDKSVSCLSSCQPDHSFDPLHLQRRKVGPLRVGVPLVAKLRC